MKKSFIMFILFIAMVLIAVLTEVEVKVMESSIVDAGTENILFKDELSSSSTSSNQ